MININSIQTDSDNEIINFVGRVNPDSPYFGTIINRKTLSTEYKGTYDAVLTVVSDDSEVSIINTVAEVTIDRMTSSIVTKDSTNQIDYTLLPTSDQNKLQAFLEMAITLNS